RLTTMIGGRTATGNEIEGRPKARYAFGRTFRTFLNSSVPMAKKPQSYASIGQVKRDISELVNRVAYGGEWIILTSRGKPKAALISVEDLEQIKQQDRDLDADWWEKWKAGAATLRAEILAQRRGVPIDVDRIIEENRRDLESRDDWLFERE